MSTQPILVPVDFSLANEPVIELAAKLALQKKADLIFLHVGEPSTAYAAGEWYYGPPEPDPEALHAMLMQIIPRESGVRCHHRMAMGDPATQIAKAADDDNVQLIVIGTHGRSGLRRVLYGSVTESVIKKAHCPVMTLRVLDPSTTQGAGESCSCMPKVTAAENIILMPTDFSDASRYALRWALDLARQEKSQLLLFHAREIMRPYIGGEIGLLEPSFEYVESMLKDFDPQDPTIVCRHLALEGVPATEIVELAKRRNVRLIVLGSHGRTGFSRLIMGSTTEDVVRHSPCPVIVIKEPTAVELRNKPANSPDGTNKECLIGALGDRTSA